MSEKEPIPVEKKLTIPKKGEIFNLLSGEKPKEEKKKQPATKEEFIAFCLNTITHYKKIRQQEMMRYKTIKTTCDLEIEKVADSLQRMTNMEALKFPLTYWKEETKYTDKKGKEHIFINMGFDVRKKIKAGFQPNNKNGEKQRNLP